MGGFDEFLYHMLIERNRPPRGGFLLTMFPRQEPCVRRPPSKDLYQVLRGVSSYTQYLMREYSKHETPPGGGGSFDQCVKWVPMSCVLGQWIQWVPISHVLKKFLHHMFDMSSEMSSYTVCVTRVPISWVLEQFQYHVCYTSSCFMCVKWLPISWVLDECIRWVPNSYIMGVRSRDISCVLDEWIRWLSTSCVLHEFLHPMN